MVKILILCTGNSCRSQMAEGWMREYTAGKAEVYSAGVETHGLNPNAVWVMNEAGVDISGHSSDHISVYENTEMDYVITVCSNAKESCPYFPAKVEVIHHEFFDPAKAEGSDEDKLNKFREVRDQIKDYCKEFCKEYL